VTTFTVNVHEEDDNEDGFWAEVQQLPGCFGSGETLAELESDIKDAIESYLLCLKEMGWPLPEPQSSTEPVLVRWEISAPELVD